MTDRDQTQQLDEIVTWLDFPEPISTAVSRYAARNASLLKEIAATAYGGEVPHFPLLGRKPLTRLATVCFLLIEQRRKYIELGVPKTLVQETFRDVTLRAALYYEKTKRVGISKDDVIWFRHLMNCAIVKVGALQFQPFRMLYLDREFLGEPYMVFSDRHKTSLPPNSPVINVHVPHGASLDDQQLDRSFDQAVRLFSAIYPGMTFKAFLCYSWLLYPPLLAALNSGSGIVSFAGKFEIIGTCKDRQQAIACVFGKRYRKKQDYPQHTTLQRLALANMKILGFGCGIRKIDPIT